MCTPAAALLLCLGGCASGTEPTAASAGDFTPQGRADSAFAPDRVVIHELGLDEELLDLDIDEGGAMEVPEDATEAGWFARGARPGEAGPTVLAGHVDSRNGPGVFADLGELEPGDEVVLEGESGDVLEYTVTEVGDLPKSEFPTEEVFGASAQDTLRVITCTGEWDTASDSYAENRIVYAEPHTESS